MTNSARWTLTTTLTRLPHCPRCGTALRPDTLTYVYGDAFCTRCGGGDYARLANDRAALRHPLLLPHVIGALGLTHFAPRFTHDCGLSAGMLLAQLLELVPPVHIGPEPYDIDTRDN